MEYQTLTAQRRWLWVTCWATRFATWLPLLQICPNTAPQAAVASAIGNKHHPSPQHGALPAGRRRGHPMYDGGPSYRPQRGFSELHAPQLQRWCCVTEPGKDISWSWAPVAICYWRYKNNNQTPQSKISKLTSLFLFPQFTQKLWGTHAHKYTPRACEARK